MGCNSLRFPRFDNHLKKYDQKNDKKDKNYQLQLQSLQNKVFCKPWIHSNLYLQYVPFQHFHIHIFGNNTSFF